MPHPRFQLAPAALAVTLAFLGGLSLPAHAQTPGEAVPVSVPAQPLGTALNELARQMKLQLMVRPDLVAGKQAPAVSGTLTPRQALTRLLAGNGLEAGINGAEVVVRQAAAPGAAAGGQNLPEVTVSATRTNDLPPAYAGGQVATGNRVGILGDQGFMDTPFNQTGFTAQFIEDRQALTVADVLDADPSVQDSGGNAKYGQGGNVLRIRGFDFSSTDITFNGLAGIYPMYKQPLEPIERLEITKGPASMLTGAVAADSVGGSINLVPKRAEDEPITRVSLGLASDALWNTHLDMGRRWGANKQWGLRFNGVYRRGDTPIDQQSMKNGVASLGLDYRSTRLKASLDFVHQSYQMDNVSPFVMTLGNPRGGGAGVPKAPDASHLPTRGGDARHRDNTVVARIEGQLTDNWTAHFAAGALRSRAETMTPRIFNINEEGNYVMSHLYSTPYASNVETAEAGLRGVLNTGPVQHRLALHATWRDEEYVGRRDNSYVTGPNVIGGSIYDAVDLTPPVGPSGPWSRNYFTTKVRSFGVADTLAFADNRVLLTLGLRRQYLKQTSVSYGDYDDSAVTPLAGLVVKPFDGVSLYANYAEGLQKGANVTENDLPKVFPPFKTKQFELGVKWDMGSFAQTLSVYQLRQPGTTIDPDTGLYAINGLQRHRGIEWNVFGQPAPRWRVLGGVAYVQSRLVRTEDGANDGNDGPGVPRVQAKVGVEWDTPFLPGLTMAVRGIHTGAAYANQDNTYRIKAWNRLDLGLRYARKIAGRNTTFRLDVENLLNRNYWVANSWNVGLGAPRTVLLSATMDF